MRIGANLAGMHQNYQGRNCPELSRRLATPDPYTDMYPGHPTFTKRHSTGLGIGWGGYKHVIAVNQVGKRFWNENTFADGRLPTANYPGGQRRGQREWDEHVPLDWRNTSTQWIREVYVRQAAVDAALAMNEGSQPPDYYSGPLWVVF